MPACGENQQSGGMGDRCAQKGGTRFKWWQAGVMITGAAAARHRPRRQGQAGSDMRCLICSQGLVWGQLGARRQLLALEPAGREGESTSMPSAEFPLQTAPPPEEPVWPPQPPRASLHAGVCRPWPVCRISSVAVFVCARASSRRAGRPAGSAVPAAGPGLSRSQSGGSRGAPGQVRGPLIMHSRGVCGSSSAARSMGQAAGTRHCRSVEAMARR